MWVNGIFKTKTEWTIRKMEFDILRSDKTSQQAKEEVLLRHPKGCYCFELNKFGLLTCPVCHKTEPMKLARPVPVYDARWNFEMNGILQEEQRND